MELSWSTFILEIINFLVLVWILIHFLYRPVLDIIKKRQDNIEQIQQEANLKFANAEALQQEYEGRLTDWEHEKQQKREVLQQEIQEERQKRMEQITTELKNERKKAEVIEQRLKTEQQNHYLEQATLRAARFAYKFLSAVASPELESKMVDILIKDLTSLDEDQIASLRQSCHLPLDKIIICSAYPLKEEQLQALEKALQLLCDQSIPAEYQQDTALIAGLRITLGSWVLRMNLQDELSSFSTLHHE